VSKTIVTLNEETHVYTDNHNRIYTSVSQLLSQFSKKFDREGISRMSAKKHGVSQEEILADWDKKRDDSLDHGNRIHNCLELYQKTATILPGNEDLLPTVKSICSEYSSYYRVFPEEIIFSEEHLIAGKTDNRFQLTSHKNSIIEFGDYKTNLSNGIQYTNKYGQYMLGPLSHLQDCNFNKYALQLSLYAYLYQKNTGCKIGSLHIMFIPPDNHLAWRKIYIPYMLYEVEAILNWRKENAIPVEEKPIAESPKSVLNNFGGSSFLNEMM
jgi:hypothetical protein